MAMLIGNDKTLLNITLFLKYILLSSVKFC